MERSDAQRRLQRSKQSERNLGKFLMSNDAPNPAMAFVASSTGRVGHITQMQYDVDSLHYVAENKQIKLSAKWLQYWLQVNDIAYQHGKNALLRIEPSNLALGSRRTIPEMHIITQGRHAELLAKEKIADARKDVIMDTPNLPKADTPGSSLPKMAEVDKSAFRPAPKPVKKVKAKR